MCQKEKEELLLEWHNFYLKPKRRFFFSFVYTLSATTFVRLSSELEGFPEREKREKLYDEQPIDDFKYEMMQHLTFNNSELYLPEVDVLIVGPGCGSGVTAHTHKCLVLEKVNTFEIAN